MANQNTHPGLFVVIKKILIQRLPDLIGIVVLIGVGTLLSMITPWSFKILVDNILGDELFDQGGFIGSILGNFDDKKSLAIFSLVLFSAGNFINSFYGFIKSVWTAKLVQKLNVILSQETYARTLNFNMAYFRGKKIGDLIYRLDNNVASVGSLVEYGIIPTITSFVEISVVFIIMLNIHPQLALFALTILPILVFLLYDINKNVIRAAQSSERRRGKLYSFFEQSLSSLKIIQVYLKENLFMEMNDYFTGMVSDSEKRLAKLTALMGLIINLVISIGYSLVLALGLGLVLNSKISAGLLLVFIYYLDYLTNPALSIIDSLSSLRQDWVSLKRLSPFYDNANKTLNNGNLNHLDNLSISYQDVYFIGAKGEKVINGISADISPNGITYLLGLNGSGKTSFISLLMRLMGDGYKGTIKLGGKDIKEYDISYLRSLISYVPQEVELLDNTIREVITFGSDKYTDSQIEAAAKFSFSSGFISRRPQKYDSKVGKEGNLLSGGQRQRLMLSRAIIRKPKILILDEIYSFQDDKSQQIINKNLTEYARDNKVIIITNDLQCLSAGDDILYLRMGKVAYHGKYKKDMLTDFNS
jgi:ABC-type multidrug transport system fused ATPase/permease subunit